MRMIDLFAGKGGFSLAGHALGWETAAFVEYDEDCQAVLRKNFPGVPIIKDIKNFSYESESERIGPVDVVCGGFPCQPFSNAGRRRGADDNRYLWPEMLRVIREWKPAWVVGENVGGLTSMGRGPSLSELLLSKVEEKTHLFGAYTRYLYRKRESGVLDEIITSLEEEGYEVQTFVIPSAAVQAPHRRDRVWIVGYSEQSKPWVSGKKQEAGRQEWQPGYTSKSEVVRSKDGEGDAKGIESGDGVTANAPKQGLSGITRRKFRGISKQIESQQGGEFSRAFSAAKQWESHWLEAATLLCGMDDGLPDWMGLSERRTLEKAIKHYGREAVERKTGLDLRAFELGCCRKSRLKQSGNAVVPQLVYRFFKAIDLINKEL
jgi:site-specific DNA-cytosine methylase